MENWVPTLLTFMASDLNPKCHKIVCCQRDTRSRHASLTSRRPGARSRVAPPTKYCIRFRAFPVFSPFLLVCILGDNAGGQTTRLFSYLFSPSQSNSGDTCAAFSIKSVIVCDGRRRPNATTHYDCRQCLMVSLHLIAFYSYHSTVTAIPVTYALSIFFA